MAPRTAMPRSVSTTEIAGGKETEKSRNADRKKCGLSQRHTLAAMTFVGMGIGSAMRMNITVAIVSMVKSTSSLTNVTDTDTDYKDGTCPAESSMVSSSGSQNSNAEFSWDEQTQAIILGAYAYGFVISQLPFGYLAVRFGGKKFLICGVAGMSVVSLLSPIAARTNVVLFILCRALTGFFGCCRGPSAHTLLGKWAPPNERSKLSSFVYTGVQIGSIIGTIATGFLCDSDFLDGWPSVFYIMGLVGIVWCILAWFVIYESPGQHPRISPKEREYIESSLGHSIHHKKITRIPWMSIIKTPALWAIVIAQVGQSWNSFTVVTELASYFSSMYHVNATTTSFLTAIPFLMSWVLTTVFSIIADKLRKGKYLSPTVIRKIFQFISQAGPIMVCLCLAFMGCNYVGSIVVFIIGVGLNGAIFAAYYTNQIDLSPNFAGSLLGISSTIGNISGIIAPIVVGNILNDNPSMSSWKTVYLIDAGIMVCTLTIYLIFGSAEEQSWNRIDDETEVVATDDLPKTKSDSDYESIAERLSAVRASSLSIHD